MGRTRRGRELDAIVLLDKPLGLTSNQALQRVRRLYGAAKAGHTGSLDPLATGMLPICFGQATKLCGLLLDASKTYLVEARLGEATDTGDSEGTVIARQPVAPVQQVELDGVLQRFRGPSQQIPPMYSALKQDGRRLHELARAGQTVVRQPRSIVIHELELLEAGVDTLTLRVHCSKGTYIRTLMEDLALALGNLAHVTSLRRLFVEPFAGEPMRTLVALEALSEPERDALLLPVDRALVATPAAVLEPGQAERLLQGVAVCSSAVQPAGEVRLYSDEGVFVGLGRRDEAGLIVPRRMFPGLAPVGAATRAARFP